MKPKSKYYTLDLQQMPRRTVSCRGRLAPAVFHQSYSGLQKDQSPKNTECGTPAKMQNRLGSFFDHMTPRLIGWCQTQPTSGVATAARGVSSSSSSSSWSWSSCRCPLSGSGLLIVTQATAAHRKPPHHLQTRWPPHPTGTTWQAWGRGSAHCLHCHFPHQFASSQTCLCTNLMILSLTALLPPPSQVRQREEAVLQLRAAAGEGRRHDHRDPQSLLPHSVL